MRLRSRRGLAVVALASASALGASLGIILSGDESRTDPPQLGRYAREWPVSGGNLSGTRAALDSPIRASNVASLKPVWGFRFTAQAGNSGIYASTPIALGGRVYAQDLDSNVFALDAVTGAVIWRTRFRVPDGGPNGLAAGYDRIYGNTNNSAFALDARTGKLVWLRRLTGPLEQAMDIAPVVANGLVYTSTIGLAPGGKGAIYALDAATGNVRWKFVTILGDWAFPREAGGGGVWWPMSVDAQGRVYAGNSNPYPWGGTPARPNGGAYRGPALYTDSLLALDGSTGKLLWYDQVIPHDVRDYDAAATPILARLRIGGRTRDLAFGAGKNGVVYAWDRATRKRLWQVPVGVHRNDRGPLPGKRVSVCPGLLGGVETPMAYSEGRLFVPVVDLCMQGSSTGYENLFHVDVAARGRGELVAIDAASGQPVWTRRFSAAAFSCATVANDVVFTATFDGRVYALSTRDGRTLWQTRMRAGVNSCPAVDGDTLLVGAGTDYPDLLYEVYGLTAFRLTSTRTGG